jgi:hypothetical protein
MSTASCDFGRFTRRVAAAACTLALVTPTFVGAAPAQDSKSAAAAKELGETLDRLKLDSIAAADPADPGTFVAALYFPGLQLLVVSAKYSAPTLLQDKLTKKEYRDVYIDLSSASIAATKVFIMDQAANGIFHKPQDDQAADSWEHANKSVSFDGDWRKAKLSEIEYTKAFTAADARYAEILGLLSAQAKKSGS